MRRIGDWARRAGTTSLFPVSLILSHARTNSSSIQAPDPFGVKNHLETYDKVVTSRGPFRSSAGGFHGTVPRLAPKGKATTAGRKPKTLKEILKAIDRQDIKTVDDLRSVIKGELQKPDLSSPQPPDLSKVKCSRRLVADRLAAVENLGFLTTVHEDPIEFFKKTIVKQHDKGFGKVVDKSELPVMGAAGQPGFGKTEFLLQVCEKFDTVSTVSSVGKPIGRLPPEFSPHFSQVVVAMASFNQGTNYTDSDKRVIEQQCIDRWALDLGWTKGFEITLGQRKIGSFTEELRKVVSRTTGERNHEKIAVILLVDEVLKIKTKKRKTLLNSLAGAMQQDLQNKRPTFTVVTSLDLWEVTDTYITDSQRQVTALPLPALHRAEYQKQKILQFLSRHGKVFSRRDEAVAWNRIVEVITLNTNGRPRSINEADKALAEKVKKEDVLKIEPVQLEENSWKKALKIWDEVFAQQLLGQELPSVTAKEHRRKRKNQLLWDDLFVDNFIFATTKPVSSTKVRDFKLNLEASPLDFLNVASRFSSDSPPPDYRVSRPPFGEVLPWELITSLFRIVKETDPIKTAKEWETGIIGLLVLRALAWQKVNNANPTLKELLPHAMMADKVENYKINLTTSCRLREVDTTMKGAQLWPKTPDGKTVFHFSLKANEAAIEGALELLNCKGRRCAGLTQNKLKLSSGPEFIGKTALKALDRASNDDDCAILFVTGESSTGFANAMKDHLAGKKVILLGTECLHAMLKPVGGNCFLNTVDDKSGTKRKGEK